uniref:Cysteine protease n=1 Tax=Brachionus rotundiformis TaxID=96890 RepID=A0A2Z4EUH5_9BILA|nr:cysteine protease ATG4-like-2 [Brachionus rotundiformis]
MEKNKKNTIKDHTMNISYFDEHSLCHVNYEDIKECKNTNRFLPNFSPTAIQESMSFINIDQEALKDNKTNFEPKDKNDDSDSSNNGIELEHVKHKLSSLWNNVKYGWSNYIKKPAKIDLIKDEPIFVLGKKFFPEQYEYKPPSDVTTVGNSKFFTINEDSDSTKPSFPLTDDLDFSFFYTPSDFEECSLPSDSNNSEIISNKNIKTALDEEIYSRLWFTYRKDFEPLNGNVKYTSDCGWGCMLRSAQMLVAQGLIYHFFGSEWSLSKSLQNEQNFNLYKDIISLFNDRSSLRCPFGLHSLLDLADKNDSQVGNKSNSRVGTWFGPTSVCTLMKESLNESVNIKLLENIRIYVAQDCTIFKPDLLDMCLTKDGKFVPCIVLISARLGGNSINEIYVETLKLHLEMKNCLGIIGGKPKHSLYFFGYQADRVLFLDPHLCQPNVSIYSSEDDEKKIFDNKSFHCSNAGYIPFNKLDPSIALGFYFKNLNEFEEFGELLKKNSQSEYFHSIFGISEESFHKLQLNYEMFSLDERINEDNVIKSSTRRKKSKEKKGYFDKMLANNNLNKTKIPHGTAKNRSGSSKARAKKSNDPDDFVLV